MDQDLRLIEASKLRFKASQLRAMKAHASADHLIHLAQLYEFYAAGGYKGARNG